MNPDKKFRQILPSQRLQKKFEELSVVLKGFEDAPYLWLRWERDVSLIAMVKIHPT
jgi:hypothetical protein